MNHLKEKITSLRLKGYSYGEINKIFGVSKSTLSLLLRDLILPPKAVKRLKSKISQSVYNGLIKRNKLQTIQAQERTKEIRTKASKQIRILNKNDLNIIGIALYWAEGYKRPKTRNGREITSHSISFTNSDPEMIAVFVHFIRVIMKIPDENIKAHIRLHPHIKNTTALNFWSKITGLSKENFMRSTCVISRASLGKRPFNRLPFGTIQITIARTNEFYRLMGWLDGIRKMLASFVKKA